MTADHTTASDPPVAQDVPTRTVNDVEVVAGLRFADPYRWLEAGDDPEVRRWQAAHNDATSAWLEAWPHLDELRASVDAHWDSGFGPLPICAADRWFRISVEPDGDTALVVADAPFEAGSEIVRVARPASVSWIAPAPDGRVLAYGMCADGSEQNTIRLVDVASGVELPAPSQPLMDALSGGVWWLPDASGFCFTAMDPELGAFGMQVYLYRRDPDDTVRLDVPWSAPDYRFVRPSRDGTHLVAIERMLAPVPVAVADLADMTDPAALRWRPFIIRTGGYVAGHLLDRRFIAITDIGAPRGRVVSIDIDATDEQHWVTLVPESDAVLRRVTLVGDRIYLTELVDTYSRVRIVGLDGAPHGTVDLPGRGAVGEMPYLYLNLTQRPHQDQFLFSFSSFSSSVGIYQHDPETGSVETLADPRVRMSDVIVEDHWATSADGTQVPFHLVRRSDCRPEVEQPTLMYAYGAYNTALLPSYPLTFAAFIDAGGVYVHAHLRGGGEFGRAWWDAGRHRHKQHTFDDLYAIAEQLISSRRTRPSLLALTGGSNGGLTAGVAVTQRPDLWGAVAPQVPQLDLIGSDRCSYGRVVVQQEYADVTDPAEVQRLATFSPYHLIRPQPYPPVLVISGDLDRRCPPWHGRKFIARLQANRTGTSPALLRVHTGGHGLAASGAEMRDQATEVLAFVMRLTGLTPTPCHD